MFSITDPRHSSFLRLQLAHETSQQNWQVELQSELEQLSESKTASQNPALIGSCKSLHDYLRNQQELSVTEMNHVREQIDQIRLQLLACGILLERNPAVHADELTSVIPRTLLTTSQSGLLFAEIPGAMILIFPSTHSYEDNFDLLSDMTLAYEQTRSGMDWLVDISGVRQLDLLLLANLLSYRRQLESERQSALQICWAPDSLMQQPHACKFKKQFDLRMRAGFWFSPALLGL